MNEHPHRPDLAGETPPERRPAPDHLHQRIESELDRTAGRRGTVVRVVAPIAAASLLASGVVGAFQISDHASAPTPADSPTARNSAPTADPTQEPTPDGVTEDVRAMTEAEISRDLRTCAADLSAPEGGARPHAGEWEVRYAMVKDRAPHGAENHMVLSDEVGIMSCLDGENYGWTAHYEATDRTPSEGRAGAETALPDADTSVCGAEGSSPEDVLISHRMFAVTEDVANVRARFVVDDVENPWTTTTPDHGHAVVRAMARGEQTRGEKAIVEVQLLDAEGKALPTDYYDGGDAERHLRTGTTASTEELTCANRPKGPFGPGGSDEEQADPVERPADDESGIADCRDLLLAAYDDEGDYTATVASTESSWGAVLHDGEHLVGCSLFPTAEIGVPDDDEPSLDEEAFHFALQATPDGDDALWAAGRVPSDVTEITYALPNGDAVDAVIDNGYWMVMYPGDQAMGSGDPSEWDPLRVTISAPGGDTVHEIAFTPETMCNQSSHGC